MPTMNQLVRHGRKRAKKKTAAPALRSNPQKRSERSTSMVKSTWPGVSIMLIR